MHRIIKDELENHLNGEASPAFDAHLVACSDCRKQVAQMEQLSSTLRDLRSPSDSGVEPSESFYNRVTHRIIEDQKKEAWGLFSPGALFFRRIAFASLLLLAGLGSLLVTRESAEGGPDAAAIMAQHDVYDTHTESADRDRLLVTLANYRE